MSTHQPATDEWLPSSERAPAERAQVAEDQGFHYHVGINWGSGFFGWVVAMGFTVLLAAVIGAVGAAIGAAQGTNVSKAATDAASDPRSVGLVGAILLAVVVFISFYCGGYVASRMSRFDGKRQGLGVWVWSLIALAVASAAAAASARFNVLDSIRGLPQVPLHWADVTTGGLLVLGGILVLSLSGAIAGGGAGMRYHRRVEAVASDY
jgi:hypothetical protein